VLVVKGLLRDGLRVAAQFTELPWVREQFQRKLGLDVWPGTVNLQVVDPAGLAVLARLRLAPEAPGGVASGVPIEPPGPAPPSAVGAPGARSVPDQPVFCVGYCFPARLGGLPAAVVVPHVPDYPADKLELVAAVRVRDALGVAPGDSILVEVVTESAFAARASQSSPDEPGETATAGPPPPPTAGEGGAEVPR
jgi:hypothetical protein